MLYREGPDGEKLSAIGFGCMRLPQKAGLIDEKEAIREIHFAIEKGINYFDTAVPYHLGASEPFLGRALAGGLREKVNIATKLPHWAVKSRDDMEKILDRQLANLRTDHIDYYLLHSIAADSWEKLKNLGVKEFLKDAKRRGKIRHYGFSYHGDKRSFKEILDDFDWEFCQVQYNYIDADSQAGTEGIEYAGQKGIPVIVMEPLHGGILANNLPKDVMSIFDSATVKRTPAERSFRWILNRPEIAVVLSGMNSIEQIEENCATASEALPGAVTEEELAVIASVKQKYAEKIKVPCTGCRYCMPCPFSVNIPECFAAYNNYHMFNRNFTNKLQYLARMGGVLSDRSYAGLCRKCGKCKKACPQGIDIPKELTKVSSDMEGLTFGLQMRLMKLVMPLQAKLAMLGRKKKN